MDEKYAGLLEQLLEGLAVKPNRDDVVDLLHRSWMAEKRRADRLEKELAELKAKWEKR